jgi:hypothetical protein
MPIQQGRVGVFTRLRAWYAGAENAEIYSRYGDRSGFYSRLMNWKGSVIAMSCVLTMIANKINNNWATDSLQHSELNRARFYKQDFLPDYDPTAPIGLYKGAVGYHYTDPATGLHVNVDNKMTSLPRDEMRERLEKNPPVISPEMLRAARALHDARTQPNDTR